MDTLLKTALCPLAVVALLSSSACVAQSAPAAKAASEDRPVRLSLKKLDADGDGRISLEEAQAVPHLASRFQEIDSDGDGALSKKELRAVHGGKQGKDGGKRDGKHKHKNGKEQKNNDGRRGKAESAPQAAEDN